MMNDMRMPAADAAEANGQQSEVGDIRGPMPDTRRTRRRGPWALAGLTIVGFIAVVLAKIYLPGGTVWTDDAYVTVHYTTVAPRITGQVTSVLVNDNERVRAGQVLATLDPRDYATAVAHAWAMLQRDRARVTDATAAIERQPSVVAEDHAKAVAARARLVFARADAKRYRYLATTGAGSVQQDQLAETNSSRDAAALDAAEAATIAATEQLDILRAQKVAAEATVRADQAALAQAKLNLSYTRIVAPLDGTIAERGVQVGDFVGPGAAIMALVPLKEVYIVANYREVDLRNVEPGQRARIHVDAYDIDLDGIVDSIPPASGAAFEPIAPNNATGNFTKIVQRMPVKIIVAPDQPLARLIKVGLSVEVTIDTHSNGRSAS